MPVNFKIFVDQSIHQPQQPAGGPPAPVTSINQLNQLHHHQEAPPTATFADNQQQQQVAHSDKTSRCQRATLDNNQRFYFDERKLYPIGGGEFSFEELNYFSWFKRQKELALVRHCENLEKENEELRQRIEYISNALKTQQDNAGPTHRPQSPVNRLSIVPQSLRPTQEYADMSCSEMTGMLPSDNVTGVVQDCWKYSLASDKFTVPIDQSQYIREHASTSTPTSKEEKGKKSAFNRRTSRPSLAGSPTLKLSPITETSRDCNSKSSSSSSGSTATPGTVRRPLLSEPFILEPDRPLDPNDPTTYRKLLKMLAEPIDRRPGFVRVDDCMPEMKNRAFFGVGCEQYLVGEELSKESQTFSAQILRDDSDESSVNSDLPTKSVCFRCDKPANDWLFYICSELHRRCPKTKPDIELSIMNADPAIMFNDGSILIDEYFRFVSLENYIEACANVGKPFPKSVGAYITLELLQLVRGIQNCDVIHMNIKPSNIIITGYPNREDIQSVDKRTSLVKLIGFEYAIDTRLLPPDFKFTETLNHIKTCEMMDSKPWSSEVDWYCILNCIHRMFFSDSISPVKEGDRWKIKRQFNGFPTNVWTLLFDELLNIDDRQTLTATIDRALDELSIWVKANIGFVVREAAILEQIMEDSCKTNRTLSTTK